MPETDTQGVNDGVLREVDFSPRTRPVVPALDYVGEQGLALLSVPLYLKETSGSSGVMSAPKPYTIVVTGDRRLCIPTAELPLRISQMPAFVDLQSRWHEEPLRQFLEGTYAPPSPRELFDRLAGMFDKYLDIPLVESRLLAAWVLGTYWFPVWPSFGLLSLTGPFGSGKSRALSVLAQLVFQPVNLANCTAAAMFRCHRTTALIDEAELLGSSAQRELKLILQASYRQEGGEVVRCAGRGRLVKWPVYAPRAIAAIKPLDDVLASRAVVVKMRRSTDAVKTSRRLDATSEEWPTLRAAVHATALLAWRDVVGARVETGTLAARRREVYHPLLQVMQWADPTSGLAAELLAYAERAETPAIEAVPFTPEDRKVVVALAERTDISPEQWMTADQIKQVVVSRFPEMAELTLASLGLVLTKHRLWSEKVHTVRGKVMRLNTARLTALAAQASGT